LVFISKINAMFTWALKPNKMPKHRLIWWRNVCSLTFFVCIGFVMVPRSRYLKSVNHKMVTWNTNRPRELYFTILFNLLFPYFPIFSLNCVWKPMQTKKVSEQTFLHQIKRCFGILFGLSAQVNMAFIFDINTNLNENYKEMS
jgi:hypothetical protein